jgi:3-oxoacyl-[acyl-carrier protein] reductase
MSASRRPGDGMVVVSGGEGGLGVALGAAFRSLGRTVLLPGRSELDVSDPASVKEYFGACGEVDLLVNAAGVIRDRPLTRLSEGDWDAVVGVNLDGAFRCAQAVLRGMLKRRCGHIIQIGSFSARRPPIGQAAYAAAKAGLIGFTQALAAEVGGRGVRVNAVLPGFLETRMTAELGEEVVDRVRNEHVLGRFNTAEDVARFITVLDELAAVSGQVFQLDSRLSSQL